MEDKKPKKAKQSRRRLLQSAVTTALFPWQCAMGNGSSLSVGFKETVS